MSFDYSDQLKAVFGKNAEVYAEKFADQSAFQESIDFFCAHIKSNPIVLELGCGPGNLSAYILDKVNPASFTGLDVAPEMIELFQKRFPTHNAVVGDINSFSFEHPLDAIIAGFCVPYLSEVELRSLVKKMKNALTINGLCYWSWILGNNESKTTKSSDGKHQLLMHYYSYEFMKSLFEGSGFEVLNYQEVGEDGVFILQKS